MKKNAFFFFYLCLFKKKKKKKVFYNHIMRGGEQVILNNQNKTQRFCRTELILTRIFLIAIHGTGCKLLKQSTVSISWKEL